MIEVTIPRKSLALHRGVISLSAEGVKDTDDAILPEANDPVDFRAEGVVKSVDGEYCVVELRFINGERPEPGVKKPATKEEIDADEEALLRKSAEASDSVEEAAV